MCVYTKLGWKKIPDTFTCLEKISGEQALSASYILRKHKGWKVVNGLPKQGG